MYNTETFIVTYYQSLRLACCCIPYTAMCPQEFASDTCINPCTLIVSHIPSNQLPWTDAKLHAQRPTVSLLREQGNSTDCTVLNETSYLIVPAKKIVITPSLLDFTLHVVFLISTKYPGTPSSFQSTMQIYLLLPRRLRWRGHAELRLQNRPVRIEN